MQNEQRESRPLIGISMGDPAGVGPEIIAKALAREEVYGICRPLVVGDVGVMERAAGIAGMALTFRPVSEVKDAAFTFGVVDVLGCGSMDMDGLEYGRVSAACGQMAFDAVKSLIDLAMSGQVDATVTAPINKEALNLAGHAFAGHTEIYARFTGTKDYVMLLTEGALRVAHVSSHASLREACDLVKKDRILKVIELAHDACLRFGVKVPRIGVAGLNPHAGEGGLFGTEEREEIIPAIEAARKAGWTVDGPFPPDTIFPKLRAGLYDVLVVMYHDQGHVPMKFNSFQMDPETKAWTSVTGVNTTLGLPIIRTSVDHGTAFDQAGKGTAREDSLMDAIRQAVLLTRREP